MKNSLKKIINKLRVNNQDYTNFKVLLTEIESSNETIDKDDILEFVSADARLQLHTTPNSISQLIADILKPIEYKSAIDICCGTGNILYYLQNQIDDLTGVEIDENVAALTSYFNPDIRLITADSFQYTFSKEYDLVVGNLPWGMMVDYNGRKLHSEEAFIRKAFDLCTISGDMVLVVPYNLLDSQDFSTFREEFRPYLKLIIGLPAGLMRNSNTKTAILHFTKRKFKEIKIGLIETLNNPDHSYKNIIKKRKSLVTLKDRWEPEYYGKSLNPGDREVIGIETTELGDLADIIKGKSFKLDALRDEGDFLYLKPIHIQGVYLDTAKSPKYIAKEQLVEINYRCIAQPGDIIISTIFTDLKLYIFKNSDPPSIISDNLAIIRSANDDYIMSYLKTDVGKRSFNNLSKNIRKGSTIPHITIKDLQGIQIPMLPIGDLNILGDNNIEHASREQLQSNISFLNTFISKNKVRQENNHLWVGEPQNAYGKAPVSELEQFYHFFQERFIKLEKQLALLTNKVDKILDKITALKYDFDSIRSLPRDEDEKIFKLYQKLDSKLDSLYETEIVTIEGYIIEVKRWLDLWELLEPQSQKFLPIAEFIFDKLSKLQDTDYAPFVVQYCRTLENEILKKLFEAYHIKGFRSTDREELVSEEIIGSKTEKFAKMVKQNRLLYTLGDMNFIMSLLKQNGTTLSESPLLQHFRSFTTTYFDDKIVEAEFLADVNRITSEFRNKAAHPSSIGVEAARECQKLLRKSLNMFLESIKIQTT